MVFKHFRRQLILRVSLLLLNMFLLTWLLVETHFYVSSSLLFLALIAQTVSLIRFVDMTNDRLTRFFASIRHADFTQVFRSSTEDRSLILLNSEMNAVLDEFRKLRADREEKELFLLTIVQHVGIGLLVYDQEGKVHLMNTACKRLLQVKALLQVNELSGPTAAVAQPLLKAQGGDAFLQKIQLNGELLQLSVAVGECLLRERRLRIASIQNIGNELNKKELEAWHMLTRVLSHEIMNSMTPIISLASSAAGLLEEQKTKTLSTEEVQDVVDAVNTIERRAGGLTRFVETYRSLTRIPRPVFKEMDVRSVFADAERWMKERADAEGIQFKVVLPESDWRITADPALIEQVLLNLLLNAVEAVQEQHQKHIELRAVMDAQSHLLIQVEDNGKGILKDIQEEIFIPFFTTKRSGSGIGLSLSRQIMALHSGTIQVQSEPGIRTVFTLKF